MRYLIQFAIPALIFIFIVYLVARRGRPEGDGDAAIGGSPAGTFIAILLIGTCAAAVLGYLFYSLLHDAQ